MNEKVHNYFYKITNLINGKYYYGIRSTNKEPEKDFYWGSGTAIKNAINKYGIENFIKVIIADYPTRHEASEHEGIIVTKELVELNECYNLRLGGHNYDVNNRPDTCGENNSFYNKTHSAETKQKISDSLKKRFQREDVWNKGLTKETNEVLKRCAESKSGYNHWNYGGTTSDLQKQRAREIHTGKIESEETRRRKSIAQSGEKNANYGKKFDSDRIKLQQEINPKNRKCSIDGIEYISSRDASRKLNLPKTTLQHRLVSKNKKFINWYYLEE